ncbi:WS/DGAT domain-containing protein [Gordonia aquimaris]|jgi:hypothetical protein|uniref:WS/DGAT domain-containing protein n=1 Tax=Gordonia aquimaris TaxID=2984863 RepID=A0A9X3D4F5_9ACTN|nr:WS/DGAT domain-containing protein [Gordonia aquimaris]MCX2964775.1 WS/DGAT domain-containing protein [Gordonia aquimaris]
MSYRAGMQRMAPADARTYWMSEAIPNDQFLVYSFADQGVPLDRWADELRRRSRDVADLTRRVRDVPAVLDRPLWVTCGVDDSQVRLHRDVTSWPECLDRIATLMSAQLSPTRHAWRAHLLGPVTTPRGRGVVVVLQICHALGDGRRAADIARKLFAPDVFRPNATSHTDGMPPAVAAGAAAAIGGVLLPVRLGRMIWRGGCAYRAARRRRPTGTAGYPPTVLNRPPGDRRSLRVIVVDRDALPREHTVTVGALTVISIALARHLGMPRGGIGAELTVGRSRPTAARNNFRNVGVDLHLEIADPVRRSTAIAAEIALARDADDEPARIAQRRADDAVPSILTHWGVRHFDVDRRPDRVTGVTVVSSVYRGADDLALGGGRVQFTTGFPTLSPAQGLTHGVHGIGDTVAISVTTSPEIMPDVDGYMGLLDEALTQVGGGRAGQDSSGSPPRE